MRVTFPHLALWRSTEFALTGQALESTQGIDGAETVVPTLRGRWRAKVAFHFFGEGPVLQWQAFLAQMEGRLGTTLVPAWTKVRPRDRDGHELWFAGTANLADAQTFEHFGFENTVATRVATVSPAALRATRIDVAYLDTTGLRPGQFFSIGECLYQVQAHWQPAENTHRLTFRPPLREAVSVGTPVEIDRPICRMRFATEEEGLFDQGFSIVPQTEVNFVEAL